MTALSRIKNRVSHAKMMNKFRNFKLNNNSGVGFALTGIFVMIFIFTSFIVNMFKLFELDFSSPYKAEVVRIASIILPIFPVTAWMDIGEENDSN
jgi:hypothetical protein